MTVTAEINIESATGRRLVKELEKHKKVVRLSYNETVPKGAISLDSAIDGMWNQLETKMGYDLRTLQK